MPKIKNDVNQQGWEDAEFPILCETCLGDNPYVRMTKQPFGKECKTCNRPFTIFRWLPGAGMRYKKTEVCQTCAKLKNVCQTCILDLEYGLPVQVRDAALQVADNMPRDEVNRQFFAQNAEAMMARGETVTQYSQGNGAGHELLKRIARNTPHYDRNRAHICSFFVKGECKRGDECPYRHEKPPEESDLSHQNIKDRFSGTNDPVAKRILAKNDQIARQSAPEDQSITSIFLSGVDATIKESDIRDYFYAFGEIKSVVTSYPKKCAFVNYTTRVGAEQAMEKSRGGVNINGKIIKMAWGRNQPQGPRSDYAGQATHHMSMPSSSAVPPPPPPGTTGYVFAPPPPPPGAGMFSSYPSQDPRQRGATLAPQRPPPPPTGH